jgi:hypothetical protein
MIHLYKILKFGCEFVMVFISNDDYVIEIEQHDCILEIKD